jgi:hypothetical protein
LKKRDEVNPTSEAIFSLTSPDHEATVQFLNELGIEITIKNQDVIYFKDPDGNILMACSI